MEAVASRPDDRPGTADQAMLDEVHDHLVHVLKEKLQWHDAVKPEMAMGGGHVVIRFERAGERFVFRVAKHGLQQHKRSMLAYRLVGGLGIIPEKVYHDGICLLERHASGAPISTRIGDALLEQLAQQLGRMHAMPAQGFGPLDFDTQGSFADASAYYRAQAAVDVDWSETDLTALQSADMNAALSEANRVPQAVLSAPVQLGHGDLWRNNILVSATEIKLLDWDHIGAYPLERDLAFVLALGLSHAQRGRFFAHYPLADRLNPESLRWFAKRHILRDRGLRLGKKLDALSALDQLTADAVLGLA
jgi:Phosphotransferase enzyme family